MVKESFMYKSMICFTDRRVIPWLMAVFFFMGLIIPCNALSTTSAIPQVLSKKVAEPDTATRARLMESYGWLPLSFEANHGQTDGKVKFLSRGSGYNLFLTATEAVLSLRKPQLKDKAAQGSALHKADKTEPATVVSMKLVGANPDPKITGVNQLPGKVNYFLGKDPKKWRTNISTYARVRYTNVYPGIDLVFYGQGQKLEYDFIVAPGADPEAIALCFGQTPLKIDQNGDLALDAKGEELCLQKPLIYQDIDGIRKPVSGGYVLHPVKNEKQTHQVGFKIAAYDRTRPLVIDPVLIYSTYLGGSNTDEGYGIAVDATGNCYVTGYTNSTDFPTENPLYPNNAGYYDAFVTSLNPVGNALIYSTYLGGSSNDSGYGIAVDATGNCYVTGWTLSSDFPTENPLYPNNAGSHDAFVTSLNPAGDALIYSTYLGGSSNDYGYGIAVDATGNCYVTGWTSSSDFPTQYPLYPNNAGGWDVFVTSLNPAGDALIYSTYLGGSSTDYGYGIAVDTTGNCYVIGCTSSTNFPTQNPLYPNNAGYYNAFVCKISSVAPAPGPTLILKKGFNLVAIPADVSRQPDLLRDWLPILGDSTEIEKVLVYDGQAGKFITLLPGDASNLSFMLKGGEGLIVYAKQDKEVNFTSILCSTLDLKLGFNLVGFACPSDGYTAFQLLTDLESENISSIQRYFTKKGAFETAGFGPDGQVAGVDFPIVPGEGYFIYMK